MTLDTYRKNHVKAILISNSTKKSLKNAEKKLEDQIDCNALQFQANVNIALYLTSLKYAHQKKLTRHER